MAHAKHYRAQANNAPNNAKVGTLEDCVKWAQEHMSNTPNCGHVTIYEAIKVVSRTAVPIEVSDIPAEG